MINIILKTNNNKTVPNSLTNDIEDLLKSIDFSPYKINDYTLYVVFDMDQNSIKNVLDLDGKKKYILFQNIPSETNYDIGFEALLTKVRLRLLRFNNIDNTQYDNVVFVFDFSQNPTKNKYMGSVSKEDKDRRAMFVPTEPKHKLKDAILTKKTRSEIEEGVSIIQNWERIYVDWGFHDVDQQVRTVLNFFGPPGTGKTMCAHGVASELGRKILCVNYANIESMWAGESPKNLISAFNVAQESNAVLFMDEADSFLGKRITNVTSGHDQSINSLRSQMLTLLEDFEGIVIFGTNLVENFDKAFETRILKNIKFELPDESCRAQLFKTKIPKKVPFVEPLMDNDYKEFAKRSEGFSGREIKHTILMALAKGAQENVETFTPEMFIDAIQNHIESKKKLEEETQRKEKDIEEAAIESIISESDRLYHEALINVAIYAMRADGVLDDREKSMIAQTAKMLDVKIPNIEDEPILSLPVVCEYFSTIDRKRSALDLACKIVAVDNNIADQEVKFIKNLYCMLGYDIDNFSIVNDYLELIVKTNNILFSI